MMRLSKAQTQFKKEQNKTASRTCGCPLPACNGRFHVELSMPQTEGADGFSSSTDTQVTGGTRSRADAGGVLAGLGDDGTSVQPHAMIPASSSRAQQPISQGAVSEPATTACAGHTCASSTRAVSMRRRRVTAGGRLTSVTMSLKTWMSKSPSIRSLSCIPHALPSSVMVPEDAIGDTDTWAARGEFRAKQDDPAPCRHAMRTLVLMLIKNKTPG